MKIGITSQNFRTITGHAGKARRFIIFESNENGTAAECERWNLAREMSMHEYRGEGSDHPIAQLDVLITAGCGQGFKNRLAGLGVKVIPTSSSDPQAAAQALLAGETLPPPAPSKGHDHHPHKHSLTASITPSLSIKSE
ncbi:MAG: nitrogen fixation protein [Chromatiales bacterium]|nr:nitrogen fixation protein [Chromatiales bacterium]